MKRAVITGLGIVSSIGNNQQEVLASLREGRLHERRIHLCIPFYGTGSG